jgi:hypothetical protein
VGQQTSKKPLDKESYQGVFYWSCAAFAQHLPLIINTLPSYLTFPLIILPKSGFPIRGATCGSRSNSYLKLSDCFLYDEFISLDLLIN